MPFLDSSSWWTKVRDVWPAENPDGEYHWAGIECPCCPWSYNVMMPSMIGPPFVAQTVVVHGWFTEQIIHVGTAVEQVGDVILDEVTW